MFTGGCLCGAVRYEASDAGLAFHCHCSRCRKWQGSAFASSVRVPLDALRITSGDESVSRYASSPGIDRCFCKVCGSSLFTLRRDLGRAHVRLGTADGDPGVRPSLHAFVGSKASWFEITDSLPRHEGSLIAPTPRERVIGILSDRLESQAAPHPLRVGVDGRTASGKTTLADEVAASLRSRGREVIRTSVDGFHRPRADRYRQGRHSPQGYLDDARDWNAIRRLLLDPLGPHGDRRYRTASFDLDRDQPLEQPAVRAEPHAIVIVDGTFLQRDELSDAWDFVIFVDVAEAVAVSRGAARDAAHLGGLAAAREMHERRYQPAFAIYEARCRPRERADVVVVNDEPLAPRIDWPQRAGT